MMMNLPCPKGSCPNFLHPIYHTLSASQAPKQGPGPMVNTDAGYSSCFFCLIVTDLHSSIMVLIYSVDTIPLQIPVSLLADVVRFRPHRLRVSVPEPCPVSDAFHQPLDRVLDLLLLFTMLPLVPVKLPDVSYLSTVSVDHKLSLSSELCKSPSVSCRLSQPVTASFSVDCCFGLCNTHAAV